MRFKLIVAFVDDDCTDKVLDAARIAGATGATVINHARGEGLEKENLYGTDLRCAAGCDLMAGRRTHESAYSRNYCKSR